MNKHDLVERMLELDRIVTDLYPNMNFNCVIVGGGALLLKDVIKRSTLDVDVLEVSKEVEELFAEFDFNTRVKAVMDCFPYNYEDRLELYETHSKSINYYTLAIEDLIVSKLYAYREKDIEDLKKIKEGNKYNIDLLEKVVLESKKSALTERRYREMVDLYQRFFKE